MPQRLTPATGYGAGVEPASACGRAAEPMFCGEWPVGLKFTVESYCLRVYSIILGDRGSINQHFGQKRGSIENHMSCQNRPKQA
jgi:hypothetical protein